MVFGHPLTSRPYWGPWPCGFLPMDIPTTPIFLLTSVLIKKSLFSSKLKNSLLKKYKIRVKKSLQRPMMAMGVVLAVQLKAQIVSVVDSLFEIIYFLMDYILDFLASQFEKNSTKQYMHKKSQYRLFQMILQALGQCVHELAPYPVDQNNKQKIVIIVLTS